MEQKEVVKKYREAMVKQGYSQEEIEVTITSFEEAMVRQPDMLSCIGSILARPVLRSWWVVEQPGARLPVEIRERRGYKPRRSEVGERALRLRKKAEAQAKRRVGERRRNVTLTDEDRRKELGRFGHNKGKRPNAAQRMFNTSSR